MPSKRNGVRPHFIRLNSRLTMGHDAFTLGFWTFVRGPTCSAELRCHENFHVRQMLDWWIIGWPIAYLGEYVVRIAVALVTGHARNALAYAYHRISFERAAYMYASQHWQEFDPLP